MEAELVLLGGCGKRYFVGVTITVEVTAAGVTTGVGSTVIMVFEVLFTILVTVDYATCYFDVDNISEREATNLGRGDI